MRVILRNNRADAVGEYDEHTGKITILAGSILVIDPNHVSSKNIQQNYDTAREMLENGSIRPTADGRLQVMNDIPGLSPSAASVIVTGRAGSGWLKWRLEGNGQLLDILRRNGATALPGPLSNNPIGLANPKATRQISDPCCNANCQNRCNLIIWQRCARDFWNRVWKVGKRAGVNQIPHFTTPPGPIWGVWVKRAFSVAKPGGPLPAPNGLAWGVFPATTIRMSTILIAFYANISRTGAPITRANWQNLLDQLNAVATGQTGLFWGLNGTNVIYGRSQKIAGLIGKYIMSTLLLSPSALTPIQQRFLDTLIDTLPAIIDLDGTLKHIAENQIRVFRNSAGGHRSWLQELGWQDFLGIQDAVQGLATARCCRSVAVYELCHIW